MKWGILVFGLVLLSCTPTRPAPMHSIPIALDVPRDLHACAAAPTPPPLPRTIQQIGDYTHALAEAHADCTRTLRRLNRWLSDKTVTFDDGTQ